MITLSKSGNTVTFTFDENSGYLQNGTIDVPVNSLSLIIDESDMATFRKSASNDIFVSALYSDFGMSKAELEAWYKENMVGSTGGGGGDITSGEVQTMIDESISGKADTSAVTQSINAAVSGKIDSESAVTNVKVLTVSQQNEVQIAQSKGGSSASTFVGTVYRVGSGLTWNYQTREFAVDSSTIATKSDLASKQDTLIEGRAIDITNNTVSLDLPISAGTGANSIQEGKNTIASGLYSHAEGHSTSATNYASHAEGNSAASGYLSHAEGENTSATSLDSHSEGAFTIASGMASHAEGSQTIASGDYSHAEGQGTIANNQSEHASGQYNVSNTGSTDADKTLLSVGNGTYNARHNAFEVRRNGDIYLTSGGTDILLQDHLGGGGKAIEAGRGISITTGATADTVSFNLPISAGTRNDSVIGGRSNTAAAMASFTFGEQNEIYASSSYATAFGYNNKIYANSTGAHIAGVGNEARNASECTLGKYNVSNTGSTTSAQTLFSIGNGTSNSARHNAFEIRQNGDIYLTKDGQDVKLQDQLGGGEVSSAIISGDTNAVAGGAVYDKFDEVEQVTAAALNTLNDNFGGLKLMKLTQNEYNALSPNYDSNTLYVIVN